MKSELTTTYQKAIADAINTNNGVINAKIAEEIAAVNQRITNEINAIKNRLNDIEKRVSDLEDKVEDLMNRKLEITFEDTENIAILAGGSCKVDYTVTSSESEVHIATIAQNGWKASVTKSTEKTGYITVYAPNPLTTEPIIVLVSDANTTIMRSLTFVDGVISIETTSFSLTNEATTLSIGVSTNLDYTISIPSTASSWISLQNITSRATMRNDVVNLNIEENTSTYNREAVLSIIFNDVKVGEIAISQQGVIIANNQLIYTSSDGAIITPYQTTGFNANIVSNTCVNGRGIITFDNDITTIGEYAFYGCGNLTSIRIPKSVNRIKDYAFYNSGLSSVEIAECVTHIGQYTFSKCSKLTKVIMGDNVTSIGIGAFSDASKLSSVMLSKNITLIEGYTFSNCRELLDISIPNRVTSIGEYAFRNCDSLTSVTIGDSVTSIGKYAFDDCSSLTSVTIPDSVTSIGERALSYCGKLTNVTIGRGVVSIGRDAFFYSRNIEVVNVVDLYSWCNIEFADAESTPLFNKGTLYINNTDVIELIIPSDVSEVKQYAFYNCSSLKNVVIQNGVTDIGDYAFNKCVNLKSVVIGESVASIGNYAFDACTSLTSVYCKPTTPPKVGYYSTFSSSADVFNIYVPRNSYNTYTSYTSAGGGLHKTNWSQYDNYVQPYDFE